MLSKDGKTYLLFEMFHFQVAATSFKGVDYMTSRFRRYLLRYYL